MAVQTLDGKPIARPSYPVGDAIENEGGELAAVEKQQKTRPQVMKPKAPVNEFMKFSLSQLQNMADAMSPDDPKFAALGAAISQKHREKLAVPLSGVIGFKFAMDPMKPSPQSIKSRSKPKK